jgi:hypothetical protein
MGRGVRRSDLVRQAVRAALRDVRPANRLLDDQAAERDA